MSYTLTTFKLPLPPGFNLRKAEMILLEIAKELSEPYFDEAVEQIHNFCRREGVNTPSLEPRVLFDLIDSKTVEYQVRMPVPYNKKSAIEQELIKRFFDKFEYKDLIVSKD